MSCDYQVAYKKDNPQVLEGCWKGQATCRGWLFYCRHLSQYLHISTMLPFFHVGVTLSEYPCHHRKLTPNPSIQPCMLKCNEISCSVSRIPIHRQPGRIKRLNSIFPRPNPWRIRIRIPLLLLLLLLRFGLLPIQVSIFIRESRARRSFRCSARSTQCSTRWALLELTKWEGSFIKGSQRMWTWMWLLGAYN